jgi:hypothetical protein
LGVLYGAPPEAGAVVVFGNPVASLIPVEFTFPDVPFAEAVVALAAAVPLKGMGAFAGGLLP